MLSLPENNGTGEIPGPSSFFPVLVGGFIPFYFFPHFHQVWDDLLELNLCYFQPLLGLQTHSSQQSGLHSSMGNVQFLHVPSKASVAIQYLYLKGSP